MKSGHVLPRASNSDQPNTDAANAVLARNLCLCSVFRIVDGADCTNLLRSELVAGSVLTTPIEATMCLDDVSWIDQPFPDAVLLVFRIGSRKQVVESYTRLVIAVVAGKNVLWQRTVDVLKDPPVGRNGSSVKPELPVAVFVSVSAPRPAAHRVAEVDPGPESIDRWCNARSHCRRSMKAWLWLGLGGRLTARRVRCTLP